MKYTIQNVVSVHNKLKDVDGIDDYRYYICDDFPRVVTDDDSTFTIDSKIIKYYKFAELESVLFVLHFNATKIFIRKYSLEHMLINNTENYNTYLYVNGVRIPYKVIDRLDANFPLLSTNDKSIPSLVDFPTYKKKSENDIIENIRRAMIRVIELSKFKNLKAMLSSIKKNVTNIDYDIEMIKNLYDLRHDKDEFNTMAKTYIDRTCMSDKKLPDVKIAFAKKFKGKSLAVDLNGVQVSAWNKAVEEIKNECILIPMTAYSDRLGSTEEVGFLWKNKSTLHQYINKYILMFKSKEAVDKFFQNYKISNRITGIDILIPYSSKESIALKRRNKGSSPVLVKYYNPILTNSVSANDDMSGKITYSKRKTFFDKNTHRTFMEIQSRPNILSVNYKEMISVLRKKSLKMNATAMASYVINTLKENDTLGISRYIDKMKDSEMIIMFNSRFNQSYSVMYDSEDVNAKIPHDIEAFTRMSKLREGTDISFTIERAGLHKNYSSSSFGYAQKANSGPVFVDLNNIDDSIDKIYESLESNLDYGISNALFVDDNYKKSYHNNFIQDDVSVISYFTILMNDTEDMDKVKKILKKEKLLKLGNAYHINAYTFLDEEKNIETLIDVLKMT